MARETDSPDPAHDARDRALWLLAERAVLSTAVCHELELSQSLTDRRPRAALDLLRAWIAERLGGRATETPVHHGLDEMDVPRGAERMMADIRAAVPVCASLAGLWGGGAERDLESSLAAIRRDLALYRSYVQSSGGPAAQ